MKKQEASPFKTMLTLLEGIDARSTVLFCHHNADPDAFCAAYALSKLLKKTIKKVKVEIAAPQGLSKLSRNVLRSIPTKVAASPVVEEADAIILLDTNTLQQLDDYGTQIECSGKPLIIIDHHPMHPETKEVSSLQIVNENASSTCEIVFNLFEQASIKPGRREAQALFTGIAYDTKHFSIAPSNIFKVAAELISLGARAEDALPLLEMALDPSERIARLKAANRLSLVRVGEWLLAASSVSSYQASAARALISLGAHIAVVGGNRGEKLSMSMRTSRQFYLKTKVHLGRDIAAPLGRHVHGMGGGHSTSAGVNGEGDVKSALSECIKLVREKLLFNLNAP